MSDGSIRRVREIRAFHNEFITVYNDDVEFPSGRAGSYVRVKPATPGDGVVIVATHANRIALVRTFRYAIAAEQWGLPRGFGHGRDPLETARVEAHEELGVTAISAARTIGSLTPDSGLIDARVQVVHLVLPDAPAEPVDGDEVRAVRWLTADELFARIVNAEIEDGFTLAAVTLAQVHGVLADGRHSHAAEAAVLPVD